MKTADTSFKLFEIINRHFQNPEDSRQLVSEIEKLVSEKTKEEAKQQASKEDLSAAKLDLIKWMFFFGVTLVLLILANWFFKH